MTIYSIDFDRIETLEDVILLLKFLGKSSSLNNEFTNERLIKEYGIGHLVKSREQKYGC